MKLALKSESGIVLLGSDILRHESKSVLGKKVYKPVTDLTPRSAMSEWCLAIWLSKGLWKSGKKKNEIRKEIGKGVCERNDLVRNTRRRIDFVIRAILGHFRFVAGTVLHWVAMSLGV